MLQVLGLGGLTQAMGDSEEGLHGLASKQVAASASDVDVEDWELRDPMAVAASHGDGRWQNAAGKSRHPMPNYAAEFVQAHNPVSVAGSLKHQSPSAASVQHSRRLLALRRGDIATSQGHGRI